MKNIHRSIVSCRGFTLIEALVFLFLFSVISLVFLQTYSVGVRLIIESKNRLGATALANQKMEVIRSIPYSAIGTKHWNGTVWLYGVPPGDLLENETISVNTVKYEVHTFVQYFDDAFDGTLALSSDAVSNDYKRVRITVSWGKLGVDQTVVIFGNFSPNGVETATGGGTLSVNILNGVGSGIAGASVHIVNSSVGVDLTGSTDATGNITLPGTPASTEEYVLTISKSGYYGATTYPAYPTSTYDPVDVHASVVANTLNQKTIVIDQLSTIMLITKDPFDTAIPNINYTLSGGRILGTIPPIGTTVYAFSQSGSTNGNGTASFTNESYGQYSVVITNAGYEFYKLSPESLVATEFTALAGVTTNMTAILLDKNIGSALIKVEKQSDSSPLSGASVTVQNSTLGYDVTVLTDQYGYAYFPTTLPALVPATYDISVTLAGYNNENSTVVIGSTLEKKTITMTVP